MYPGAYSWTNSYPIHYAQNDDPEIPFHMKTDPLNSPPYHQPWPYSGGSYSYPVPHEYHGCCNHNHYGGSPYSFRPPYPHYPPTLHTHGFYPPFPGAYPAYSTPPPRYSFEQPRYDYDKKDHVPHHCCGCNHQENEKKSSRMEREEPEVEKKTRESLVPLFLKDSPYPISKMNTESKAKENEKKSRMEQEEPEAVKKINESLVPLFLKDSPYPIMWVPPRGNMNEESKAKENEKKLRIEREEPKFEKKTNESLVPLFFKDSPYPVMWVPPHGNTNEESKAKENEKKLSRVEPEVEKKTSESLVPLFLKDSPYPIMWVPPARYMNEESKAKDKEKHSQDPVTSEDVKPIKRGENGEGNRLPFPIFWLPSKNNDVGNETKDNNFDLVSHKRLPDENKREDSDSKAESETRNKNVVQKVIPVKQMGANEGKKSAEENMKSDSVEKIDNRIEEGKASPKSSKLPPVCLRIDPLPRKKKSSRSPSPPGVKDRSISSQQETHMPESLKKEEEQSKDNIKTVVVTTDENKVENNSLTDPCDNLPKYEQGKVEEKNKFSEQEAALMIQSAYRGFEVRKSQPLTKLRQLGEVTKQVVALRKRIQDMESSSSTISIDDKQKLIIGETIMGLLLKLDTIQGLHPIVRDVRKSVAKELVGLQGKLDSLTSTKSETPIEETVSNNKQVMHLEDDAIVEKSDRSDSNVSHVDFGPGLRGNHEVDAKKSHDDGGAEAYNANLKPLLHKVKSTGDLNNEKLVDVQQKFDQALTQIDSTNEAIDSAGNGGVEVHDIKPEQLLEHNTGELNNNQIQMSVETERPVDNSNQEKSDQVEAESDSTHEVVGYDTVISENHEVEAIGSVDNNGEGDRDTKPEQLMEQNDGELNNNKLQMLVKTEQPLDNSIQEKSDEVLAESGTIDEIMKSDTDICENHEVENAQFNNDGAAEAGDISFEAQVELKSQQRITELTNNLEIQETEQPVKEEKTVHPETQFESAENVGSAEVSDMEDKESQDVGEVETNVELSKEEDVSEVEMNVELSKEEAMKEIPEDLVVPTEEAPKADDAADDAESSAEILIEDLGETPPALPLESHVTSNGDGKITENPEGVPSMPSTNGGDTKLMEENEKLRVAVEELLKAGNEQLGVIKELSGKVKDLEKKLSKKNKKSKVNKGRSRGFVVQDELSDCLV